MLSGVKHITCCREEISWSRRFAMPHTKSRFATVNCHVSCDGRVVILPMVYDIVAARSVRLLSGRWRNDAKIIGCHGTRVYI